MRCFRPDGSAVDTDGSLKVAIAFESAADATSSQADSHCGAVHALAVCGKYICSAGSDAMIRCWRLGSLELVRCACHTSLLTGLMQFCAPFLIVRSMIS